MLKRFTLIPILFVMATSWAHAQLEALLFGAAGAGINTLMAKSQEKVFPAGKLCFDILEPRGDGYEFTNFTWDPTTQTKVFVVDGLALQAKPFINGPPPHDIQVWVNDSAYTMRKVKGGRFGDKGRPVDNAGVVGDYPIIDARDLPYGSCQIKVRLSKTTWLSAEFVRLRSVDDLMASIEDEELRKKLYGFGGATFPMIPTFLAKMPNGSLKTFLSAEEMQLALNGQPAAPNAARQDPPAMPGATPTGTNQAKSNSNLEIHMGFYAFEDIRGVPETEARTKLAAAVTNQPPQGEAELAKQILIPQGKGLALVVLSEGEFHGELIDPAGRTIKRYEPTRANSSGPYALFIPFHFGRDSKENSLVLVTSTGNRQELRFRRGE